MIEINDATLREGNQASGVKFTVEDSVRIATKLDLLGADMIEIGHPLAGNEEFARAQAVAELGLRASIVAHARAHPDDIRAVAKTGAQWVGIFLGVNDITMKARVIGHNFTQLVEMVVHAVREAKDCGLKVRYSCEDASRTDDQFLFDVFSAAVEAGADRICYADTIGHANPHQIREKTKFMTENFGSTSTEVHLHDDRGLAMANALAAVEAGITSVSTSVNGLGERTGITEFCNFLVNLGFLGMRPLPDIAELRELSQMVSQAANTPVDPLRPVVGDNAFKHGSKLHIRATSYEPRAYDWIKEFVHSRHLVET
jgi:2-isopropylmalate synthase